MTQEDGFERFAYVNGQPSILLCDRGLMDGSVYMQPEEWACLVSPSNSHQNCCISGIVLWLRARYMPGVPDTWYGFLVSRFFAVSKIQLHSSWGVADSHSIVRVRVYGSQKCIYLS